MMSMSDLKGSDEKSAPLEARKAQKATAKAIKITYVY